MDASLGLDGAHGRTDEDSGYGGAAGVFFLWELMCPLPTARPCGKVPNVENLELHSIVVVGPHFLRHRAV